MNKPVSIVLSGMGGYGNVYLEALLNEGENVPFHLAGAVDPEPERCKHLDRLHAEKVPVFSSLEAFYDQGTADLAVIASPPHRHCSQTCLALAHGSHVLCEKPAAVTVEEVDRMIECEHRFGRWVAIGYQWSFSLAIQALKLNILAGAYGAPISAKSLCLWPRKEKYYTRNNWAGRVKEPGGGWVLDSPVNNAMAHYLHNLLYLLGDKIDRSAQPATVTAELYRANPIENYDTAALRIHTKEGVEILFYASHAVPEDAGPVFCIEFEKAVAVYAGGRSPIQVHGRDGSKQQFDSPERESEMKKLFACIHAAAEGGVIPCGLEAARAHTLVVNGAQESVKAITTFPRSMLQVSGRGQERLIWVEGLAGALLECYDRGVLWVPGFRKLGS